MRILLIGQTKGGNVRRLEEAFTVRGHTFQALGTQDLYASIKDDRFELLSKNGDDLLKYDVYFFRGIVQRLEPEINTIAKALQLRGKQVIEPQRTYGGSHVDKLILPDKDIRFSVPDYELLLGPQAYAARKRYYSFPLIAKSTRGSMGRTVHKVSSATELDAAIKKLGFPAIIQSFIDAGSDIRVLVVGGRVVGAFRRYSKTDDFLTTRPGGKREETTVTEEMEKYACNASRACELEIAGVDLIEGRDGIKVLEVNASPQFRMFEKVVGIDVAEVITKYIEALEEKNRI